MNSQQLDLIVMIKVVAMMCNYVVIDSDFGSDMIDLCSLSVSKCICIIACNNA